jgi:hypothetical protein
MDTKNIIYMYHSLLFSIDDTSAPAFRFPILVQLSVTSVSFHFPQSPTDIRQQNDRHFVWLILMQTVRR